MDKILTVTQLNNYIRQIFIAEELLHNISITGEVLNVSRRGEYLFFCLADKEAQIEASCFQLADNYIPKSGESVILKGNLSYYTKRGKLTFVANKIQPAGKGALLQHFDELKKKLEAEGIFSSEHKKLIPQFAGTVCVVTSIAGAVIRDIVTTIRKKNPVINIKIIDTRVQGGSAPSDIIRSLRLADSIGADVIILARGGGSLEDLLPFFDEDVVREVYKTKTPVISAIGHETDITLTDFAADVRAPTPTAAGEMVAYDYFETIRFIKDTANKISCSARRKLKYISDTIIYSAKNIALTAENFINKNIHKVELLISSLNYNNPCKLLSKGLHQVNFQGKPLTKIDEACIGGKLDLISCEGTIITEIKSVQKR